MRGLRVDICGLGQGPASEPCERGNECWVVYKMGNFLEQISDWQFLKYSSPCN